MYTYVQIEEENGSMITVNFTEFRKRASELFSEVENGESIVVTRHGKPIAEIIGPGTATVSEPSWKRPINRISIPGGEISRTIIEERESGR